MRVIIGSDHAGFQLKEQLKPLLANWGHEVEDVGCHSVDSCDYPDIAETAALATLAGGGERLGVLICGTGVGMAIAANKTSGIRAAACSEPFSARMARRHNDANMICLGARVVGPGLAEEVVKAFLEARFEGGRHRLRVDKIAKLDRQRP